jgi:hypothetical protein
MPVAIHVCEYSWVVDGNEGHLDEMGKGVIIAELCEVLAIVDESIMSYSMWIGDENVPMHGFSSSCSSENIRLLVLDAKADEGEGSKALFSGEVSCVEGEEVK